MSKLLLVGLLTIAGLFWWQSNHQCETAWTGVIDSAMVEQVKHDIQAASGCGTLRISLFSPGGGVFDTLEIVREMERAKTSGLILEVRGKTLVASGATFILGAGSVGHRWIEPGTLGLVHGIRTWYSCISYKESPFTEDEKFGNAVIEMMVLKYAELSGKSVKETFKWMECDNSQVGDARFLIRLGLVDHYGG